MAHFFPLTTTHYRWLAVLWTIGIVVACSLPPRSLSAVQPALGYDKIAHVGLFVGFAGLWMRVLCPPDRRPSMSGLGWYGLLLLGLGGAFAAGSEVYQHVLPLGRTGDPYDFLADGVGLLLGIVLYAWMVRERPGPMVSSEGRSGSGR